jgi:hypothetical protein
VLLVRLLAQALHGEGVAARDLVDGGGDLGAV